MGLDAYFCVTDEDNVERDGDNIVFIHDNDKSVELGYFRKNWYLQEQLTGYWSDLNPDKEHGEFNCSYLKITPAILEDLVQTAEGWIMHSPQEWEQRQSEQLLIYCHMISQVLNNEPKQVVYYFNWY